MGTQTISRPTGRPPAELDWELIDEHLHAGCSGTSIASVLKVYRETLYDGIQRKYGMTFTEYAAKFHTVGDDLIKKTQFDKAIGRTKKGDTTLLLHLGRTRLKQVDAQPEKNDIPPNDPNMNIADAFIRSEAERMKMAKEIEQLKALLNKNQEGIPAELRISEASCDVIEC